MLKLASNFDKQARFGIIEIMAELYCLKMSFLVFYPGIDILANAPIIIVEVNQQIGKTWKVTRDFFRKILHSENVAKQNCDKTYL